MRFRISFFQFYFDVLMATCIIVLARSNLLKGQEPTEAQKKEILCDNAKPGEVQPPPDDVKNGSK